MTTGALESSLSVLPDGEGAGTVHELPARVTSFTPHDRKKDITPLRDKLYRQIASLRKANERVAPFCTDPESIVNLSIRPEDAAKIVRPQYKIAHALRDAVTETVNRWLKEGKIERAPNGCRFNSPLLAVPKKDENGKMSKVRVCLDVRAVNQHLIEDDKFQLPSISEGLATFAGGKLFGEFDLSEAYFQFKLAEDAKKYTAFMWNGQQYVFVGCPFGLKHIPSLFQRYIANLFRDMPFIFPYIDNLAFASVTWDEHYQHAAAILERLNSVNLRIKQSAVNLGNTHIKLLGHIISEEGVAIDPEKQEMMEKWPRPDEGIELASVLGLGAFLRDHIRHYADITAPLEAVKRHKRIEWTDTLNQHWLLLKRAFLTVPLLRFPDFRKRFVLATDASQTGVGGVLFQPDDADNTITPMNIIAICSKQLDATQRNYPVYKKELFAVIYCLRKFHTYVWGRRDVTILTDHKPLIHITRQKVMTVALQQWLDVLLDYDLMIAYRPGILHIVPDALSRMYLSSYLQEDATWGTQSNIQFLENFKNLSSPSDFLCQQSLNEIKMLSSIRKRHQVRESEGGEKDNRKHNSAKRVKINHTTAIEHDSEIDSLPIEPLDPSLAYEWISTEGPFFAASQYDVKSSLPIVSRTQHCYAPGVLTPCVHALTAEEQLLLAQEKRGKTVPTESEQQAILEQAHAQGHFGVKAIYNYIDELGYWWPHMRDHITNGISACPDCRKYTVERAGYHPAQSIFADRPGDHFQIDLAQFPVAHDGAHYCLVCVDVFTGFVMLKPLKSKDADVVARALWEIFTVIGIPKILQSDNGREFSNQLLTALSQLLGVPQRFISPYNPRADGKVERVVKTVTDTVVKLLHGATIYWPLHIPFVQYAYNSKVHSLTGSTPFSLMLSRAPNRPIDYSLTEQGKIMDLPAWKQHQQDVLDIIYPAIAQKSRTVKGKERAQQDKKRRVIVEGLAEGTEVELMDPKFLHQNKHNRPKTAAPMFGPYYVVKRVHNGGYKVKDELGQVLERTVPLDQMKVLNSPEQLRAIPKADDQGEAWAVDKILGHRFEGNTILYHTKWTGFSVKQATWVADHKFVETDILDRYWRALDLQNSVAQALHAHPQLESESTMKSSTAVLTTSSRRPVLVATKGSSYANVHSSRLVSIISSSR